MGKPYPGLWTFKYHPWLEGMHTSTAPINIGQKSAQMGYTETVLNVTFYKIDIERVNCLYVLPAKTPDASDFSASRFDAALELCPYLKNLFQDVKNVGHKRAGSANLYIRGSRSRSGLKSIPVAFFVLDELDEMDQDNVPMVYERASGQVEKQGWEISTPTVPETGINARFQLSTQEHFYFPCPHCSKYIQLKFPDNIIITADHLNDPRIHDTHLICNECKGILDHKSKPDYIGKGKWVAEYPGRDMRGFYVNQLYSPTVAPHELADAFLRAQTDPAAEQEFYNSKLGLAHTVAGARVTEEQINACIGPYEKLPSAQGVRQLITIGIDVGKRLHCEIDAWDIPVNAPLNDINSYARPKVIWQGTRLHFEELDDLMRKYAVNFGVIDANPDRRKAFEFAQRWWNLIKLCTYSRSVNTRQVVLTPETDQGITVDRTSWLDLSLGRFHRGKEGIMLPTNVDYEYKKNVTNLVRVYSKDDDGNPIAEYKKVGEDHYGHARNYAEIALVFAAQIGQSVNIRNPL